MASDGSTVRDVDQKQKQKQNKADVEDSDAQLQIHRLTTAGHAALRSRDYHAALQHFKSAFKTAGKQRERRVRRACALNLGAAYVESGDAQKGLEVLMRLQPGARGQRMADLQFNLATAHEALQEPEQAKTHYQQAAQLYRSQGDADAEGDTCCRLAHCQQLTQEWTEAAESLQRAADSYKTAGNVSAAALVLKDAGKHMLQSGCCARDDIISVLTDSLELSAHIQDQDTRGKLLNDVGLSFSQMRLFSEACVCYEQALPLVSAKPQRLAVVLQNLGAVHNTQGQFQQALRFHREAAALHGSQGSRGAQGRCFSNLGFALVELGELEEAWESYTHAQQAFRDTDDACGQYQVSEGLGGIKLQMKDPERAAVHYQDALRMLCRCQDVSSSVQERLVSKLSEALQQKLILQQFYLTVNGAAALTVTDTDLNLALREQQQRRDNTHDDDRNQQAEMMTSSEPQLNQEQADQHRSLPEANRNLNNTYDKAEVHQQNGSLQPSGAPAHGDVSVKPRPLQMNGAHPLARSSATLPTDRDEATPLKKRLKSIFCTVM
ncbi:tetratricopeptide repeat protein 24 [Danio aesculapii]|uniref:tetratricopeptide repeat protein 24 n=1 Tax=Danio aesculapii TaxID=1142201 RepID=UPI0024C05B4A|nr:tetratricopeptide repeat protein 24 [Danio aesculapii]